MTPESATTPRTSAEEISVEDCDGLRIDVVSSDFARTLETELAAMTTRADAALARVAELERDAFQAGYIQGHEATLENRYNLEGATVDFLADAAIDKAQEQVDASATE